MKVLHKLFVSALLLSAFTNLSLCSALHAAPVAKSASTPKPSSSPANSVARQQKLRRFDFRLEGVSCGRCIVNIRTALRQTKGVSRCEVALRKPYGGVVVYDPILIDMQKLTKITMTADPKTVVTVKDPVDEVIQNVPVVLIPKYTSLQKDAEKVLQEKKSG